jgi:hypothetical protein
VEVGHREAADAEAAAVEVDEHRQLPPAGAGGGALHAAAQGVRGVVDHVLPLHGRHRRHVVGDERDRGEVCRARHRAVAEQPHDAEAVLDDARLFRGRAGRRRGHGPVRANEVSSVQAARMSTNTLSSVHMDLIVIVIFACHNDHCQLLVKW